MCLNIQSKNIKSLLNSTSKPLVR